MLKVSSNEENTNSVQIMVQKTNESKQILTEKCKKQTILLPNGIKCQQKNLKLIDTWILFKRLMVFSYVSQWKAVLMQFLITIFIALFLRYKFNANKAKVSQCLHNETNQTCLMSIELWEEEEDISETIKYNFCIFSTVIFLQLVVTTLTFSSDVNVFLNERRNGMYSLIID